MLKNSCKFRVRFNETDSLGIVWHGHYITYFEDGREAFGEEHGLAYQTILGHGYLAPIVSCHCDYKSPLRYGDWAEIETTYIPTAAAKVVFRYCIRNAAQKLVANGQTIQVFTDLAGELILTNPPFYEAWKAMHAL